MTGYYGQRADAWVDFLMQRHADDPDLDGAAAALAIAFSILTLAEVVEAATKGVQNVINLDGRRTP